MKFDQDLWDLVPLWERECDHHWIHVLRYTKPQEQFWLPAVCSRPWCYSCEAIRTSRMSNRIGKYVDHHQAEGVDNWWFLTRSVKNHWTLLGAFRSLRDAQRRFHSNSNRPSHPFHSVEAYVAVTEITYGERSGYNVHQHMLLGSRGELIPYARIRDRWSSVTKFSSADGLPYRAHVSIKRMDQTKGAIRYMTKYITKGSWGGMSRGRVYLVRNSLKGRNRIRFMRDTLPKVLTRALDPFFIMCCTSEGRNCARADVIDATVVEPKWSEYHRHLAGEEE